MYNNQICLFYTSICFHHSSQILQRCNNKLIPQNNMIHWCWCTVRQWTTDCRKFCCCHVEISITVKNVKKFTFLQMASSRTCSSLEWIDACCNNINVSCYFAVLIYCCSAGRFVKNDRSRWCTINRFDCCALNNICIWCVNALCRMFCNWHSTRIIVRKTRVGCEHQCLKCFQSYLFIVWWEFSF